MKITNVSVRNCTQILDGLARTCVIKVIVAEFFVIISFFYNNGSCSGCIVFLKAWFELITFQGAFFTNSQMKYV